MEKDEKPCQITENRCVERGVDVKSVSELLGHADVRTTLRLYVHSSMDYKRRAVEGIGFLKGIT